MPSILAAQEEIALRRSELQESWFDVLCIFDLDGICVIAPVKVLVEDGLAYPCTIADETPEVFRLGRQHAANLEPSSNSLRRR
jgi:hypothetical protein